MIKYLIFYHSMFCSIQWYFQIWEQKITFCVKNIAEVHSSIIFLVTLISKATSPRKYENICYIFLSHSCMKTLNNTGTSSQTIYKGFIISWKEIAHFIECYNMSIVLCICSYTETYIILFMILIIFLTVYF